MKYMISFVFLIIIFFYSCTLARSMDADLSPESALVFKAIKHSGSIVAKKYNLSPSGIGGGKDGKFWLLTILFSAQRNINQSEARKLILDCVDEFLLNINSNEDIKPYLQNVPSTPQNVDLSIFFQQEDGRETFYPYIGVVGCNQGTIIYATNSKERRYHYESYITETYEEALAILNRTVNEQDSNYVSIDEK